MNATDSSVTASLPTIEHAVTIEIREASAFFYARHYAPAGAIPDFALPKPLSIPISRLLHSKYALNRATDTLRFAAKQGCALARWDLSDGEELCFRCSSLIGFSSELHLQTIINAQLGSFSTLETFFSVATGPGTLLFEIEGTGQVIGPAESHSLQVPPSRLVAWQRNAEFRPSGAAGIVNLMVSEFSLNCISHSVLLLNGGGEIHHGRRSLWHAIQSVYRV